MIKRIISLGLVVVGSLLAQLSGVSVSSPAFTAVVKPTYTQAEISYKSPNTTACTADIADMQRGITIGLATQTSGVVTVNTNAPHGLVNGNRVYLETTVPAWNGWQTITVASSTSFTFLSSTSGFIAAGNVGVEVDDVNTTLFPGSNLDTRAGNTAANGRTKFNVCARTSQVASDGLYHSRACQTNARHHLTLTCSGLTYDSEFVTANIPVGDTYNPGVPIDLANPGSYAYSNVNFGLTGQAFIDPISGILSRLVTGPSGKASSSTVFGAAIDIQGSSWTNPSEAISGGSATFTPPCASGTCALLLRADGLTISGGASYAASDTGSSLDWFQPAPTLSISNGSCTGDDCKVTACLTVSGPTCSTPTQDFTLTTTPTQILMGSTSVMDLWQQVGPPLISRPDAVEFSGSVSYNASTGVVTWLSGNYFDLNWTSGSGITLGGPISAATLGSGGKNYVAGDVAVITQAGATLGSVTITAVNGTTGAATAVSLDVTGNGYLTASGLATVDTTCTVTCTGAGMTINVTAAGTPYTLSTLTSEASLTLAAGPGSNMTAAYKASNFGVLIWKKTANSGTISVSSSTYKYGSSPFPGWNAAALDACSSASPYISVNSKPGVMCFIQQELFWIANDGSQVSDLGAAQTASHPSGAYTWISGYPSAPNTGGGQFDPQNANCWYTSWPMYYGAHLASSSAVVQVCYSGTYSSGTPGGVIADCALNGNTQPCLAYTNMMPTWADVTDNSGTAFNPAWAAAGATFVNPLISTIDPTTSTIFVTAKTTVDGQGGGQDWPAWMFAYQLGDRTPMGTDAGSFAPVGAASTYLVAPGSYCTLHNSADVPYGGWAQLSSNDTSTEDSIYGTYTMTFASGQATLNTTVGVTGGLNACPSGIPLPNAPTGNLCTTITAAAQPTRQSDSLVQNLQLGDVMQFPSPNESMRVVQIISTSPLQFVVQRAYGQTVVASHSGTVATMTCGTYGLQGSHQWLWHYTADPYGTNTSYNTIVTDQTLLGGHHYIAPVATGAVSVSAAGAQYNLGALACPSSSTVDCTQARLGNLYTASTATTYGIAMGPGFDGVMGMAPGNGSDGNGVDDHPGPCFNGQCLSARPIDGGLAAGDNSTQPFIATSSSPFVLVAGQLWKFAGANTILHRKILYTFAYIGGRHPLVDVSGPSSSIGTTSSSKYTYCYTYVAGECYSGSSVGDVYVNAPNVNKPYCWYPGIALQPDDVTSICIGDLGSQTASVVQYNVAAANDWTGIATRRLGPQYTRYGQMNVFWNMVGGPSMTFFGNYARWLDDVRFDIMVSSLPPMRAVDGVDRTTFIPVTENLTVPAGVTASTALIEFGYADNGSASSFYCVTRREACVTVSATVPTGVSPFWYETADAGSYTRMACVTGCVLTIPARSGEILYWREKYFNSSGSLVYTGQLKQEVTP